MTWLLKRQLHRLADRSNPDRAFEHALEKTLRDQTGHPVWWVQGWKYALAGVSIVSLVGSATGVYAYTSDDVLPDSSLYPVRQGIERVQEVAAVTPGLKVSVQLRLLKRRLHEQELIAVRQRPISEAKQQTFDEAVAQSLKAAARAPSSTEETIDDAVSTIEAHHEQALIKERDDAKSPEQKTRIEGIIKKQRDSVKNMIDSLESSRRERFNELMKRRLDGLHGRLDKLNKRLGDRNGDE